MIQQGILIEATHLNGQTEPTAARHEAKNRSKFLKSDLNALWFESEILTFSKPWSSNAIGPLEVTNDSYCFAAFSAQRSSGSVVLNIHNEGFAIISLKHAMTPSPQSTKDAYNYGVTKLPAGQPAD